MSKRPKKPLYKSKSSEAPPPLRELPLPPKEPRATGPLDNPEDNFDDEEADGDTEAEFGA